MCFSLLSLSLSPFFTCLTGVEAWDGYFQSDDALIQKYGKKEYFERDFADPPIIPMDGDE